MTALIRKAVHIERRALNWLTLELQIFFFPDCPKVFFFPRFFIFFQIFFRLPKVLNNHAPKCGCYPIPNCLTRLSPRFIVNRVQIKLMHRNSIDCPNGININVLVVLSSSYSVLCSSRYTSCFKIPVDRGCIRSPEKRLSSRLILAFTKEVQCRLALKKHRMVVTSTSV